MAKTAETLIMNIPVRRQTLRDLLCTAVEGGSNYWGSFKSIERTDDLDYLKVKVTENEQSRDDVLRVNRYVLADDLLYGIERLAKCAADDECSWQSAAGKHLADALGDHDATTADVVLQMTVFGELIYG